MSYGERRMNVILEELRRNQRVQVADLSEMLGVSQESIRRDLKEMEARGHLRRVYGGAVADEKEADRPYSDRLRLAMREKIRIGQAAAALIENGMKVFIDTGTTAVACLRHLGDCRNVTVVSNSVAIAAYLCERPEIGFRMLGGRLRPEYQAVYGHETMTALREHYFDLALLGISTVHLDRGFMDFGEDEAELRRIARDRARRSVVLADSSKFGRLGSIHTFDLDQAGGIVTSGIVPADFTARLQQLNVDLIHA